MTDRRLRDLERRAVDGGPDELARLLRERLRAGQVSEAQLAIAAWAGDPPARAVLGRDPPAGVELAQVAWARLEQWFARHAPASLANLRPGASEDDLRRVRLWPGRTLPAALVASSRIHDGQAEVYPAFFRESWELLSLERAREIADALRPDVHVPLRPTAVVPPGIHPAVWSWDWLPFAAADDSMLCVDLGPAPGGTVGQVIRRTTYCNYELVAPGVDVLLARFARDLDAGLFITDGAGLFTNDEVGREQRRRFAELAAKRARRAAQRARRRR